MMPTAAMTARYRHGDRQVYRLIAGEHLLIDVHSKSATPFFALTPTAVPLWKALGDWRSEEELAAHLVDRYHIDAERAIADVREFLEQLDSIGALVRDEEGAA